MKILPAFLVLFAASCASPKSIQPDTLLSGRWKIINSDMISETAPLLSTGSTLSFGKDHVLTYTPKNGQRATGKWYTKSETDAYSPFQDQFSPFYRYTMGDYDYQRQVYFDSGKEYKKHRLYMQLPSGDPDKSDKIFFVLVPQGRNRVKINLDPLDQAVLSLNTDFYKLKRIRKNTSRTPGAE
ncbi:hypothetical protein [Niabella drilacis]|uniref:Uncharacterized protein n=1 Tax=Niabella drilacis (strain DSM 25811 / CCM 8410 / CCUG 62505 / LMG 26954 / E90) TaxID=1285928 RepID=A0A1G6IN25_NIADE|nr:hypothetical protein [Niabella drilacis]SDC07830.1 hypothetical protein SAMN04487894_101277 [Niabella drilacis]